MVPTPTEGTIKLPTFVLSLRVFSVEVIFGVATSWNMDIPACLVVTYFFLVAVLGRIVAVDCPKRIEFKEGPLPNANAVCTVAMK